MTMFKAIKSGLPFKRKDWAEYYVRLECIKLTIEDALADDWEVRDKLTTKVLDILASIDVHGDVI